MTILSQDIEKTIANLPKNLQDQIQHKALSPYTFFSAQWTENTCKLLDITREALGLALLPIATAFAEAPVSDFHVGAVAFDSDGNAYLGANFEFAGTHIGQVIHAEQSAISHAWTRGASELALLVINYAPCGHCRQFINEVKLADDFCILLPESEPQALSAYLPNPFGPADLGIEKRILDDKIIEHDNLYDLAHNACATSHAPYSGSLSGVAIKYEGEELVLGRYAENAAFNPSLPALQVALNYRRLQNKDWQAIEQIIMVEKHTTLSQKSNTEELLNSISEDILLEYYLF